MLGKCRFLAALTPYFVFIYEGLICAIVIADSEEDEIMPRYAWDVSIIGSDVESLQHGVYTPRKSSNSNFHTTQLFSHKYTLYS